MSIALTMIAVAALMNAARLTAARFSDASSASRKAIATRGSVKAPARRLTVVVV